MAWPVYRMRCILVEMAKEDLSLTVSRLRKKDEFKHLFVDINTVKEHWRTQIRELRLACQELGENGSQEQHLKRIKKVDFFVTKQK